MPSTQSTHWRAGRFWWSQNSDGDTSTVPGTRPLRAVVFDLDALADIEFDGNRLAFNEAFAVHGVPVSWSATEYRRLLAIKDERRRIEAGLCRRGYEPGLLTDLLADEILSTKELVFDELILDTGLNPRDGLVDLVMDAYLAGVWVAVVTSGRRRWAEPLVRQLVGDGIVETVVTADDISCPGDGVELFRLALWEMGIDAADALAVTGSATGLHDASAAGLAAVAITTQPTVVPQGAVAVRADYGPRTAGVERMSLTTCQGLHGNWWATHRPATAAA